MSVVEEIIKITDESKRQAQIRILTDVLEKMEEKENPSDAWETAKGIIRSEIEELNRR